jgi:Kef-type K+ transport system membrane component KefB
MSDKMEYNTSIDAAYEVVERIEQQKRRLNRNLVGTSILASLGLMVNTFVFMIFSNQKGAFDNTIIILFIFTFLICMVLLGLAIRKYILLKKFKHRLNHISELEETIYDEVLKLHLS